MLRCFSIPFLTLDSHILLGFSIRPLIGGEIEQSFLYPIYAGLILLAGLIVGAAVVLYGEMEEIRKEIKSIKEDTEKRKQENE